jgi:hypothetical protein
MLRLFGKASPLPHMSFSFGTELNKPVIPLTLFSGELYAWIFVTVFGGSAHL